MFISFLYVFWATMCPSSEEITVYLCDTWYLSLCVDDSLVCRVHTRPSFTQSDKYQVSHRYSYFSRWRAHSRPKHVKKKEINLLRKIVHQFGFIYKIPLTVVHILTVQTNAQFHRYVFLYKLAPTCFGFTAVIRDLTTYY